MKTAMKLTSVDMESRTALEFSSGDTLRVWSKITDEKGKSRLQAFEGMVLARKHGAEIGATFTLRKVANGVGVERIFPLFSPVIDKIEIVKRARARRSKLYYVREKAVRDVRRKMKQEFRNFGALARTVFSPRRRFEPKISLALTFFAKRSLSRAILSSVCASFIHSFIGSSQSFCLCEREVISSSSDFFSENNFAFCKR
jgi:large subunit ribosomal protein L19